MRSLFAWTEWIWKHICLFWKKEESSYTMRAASFVSSVRSLATISLMFERLVLNKIAQNVENAAWLEALHTHNFFLVHTHLCYILFLLLSKISEEQLIRTFWTTFLVHLHLFSCYMKHNIVHNTHFSKIASQLQYQDSISLAFSFLFHRASNIRNWSWSSGRGRNAAKNGLMDELNGRLNVFVLFWYQRIKTVRYGS